MQTGSKTPQHVSELEATLLFVGNRDVIYLLLVEADHERGNAATPRHIVQCDDLESSVVGSGKSRD